MDKQQALSKTREYLSLSHELDSNRIEELREVLRFHEWRYYIKHDAFITDQEYDQLYKMLESMEQSNPALITEDSPTQRIPTDVVNSFDSIPHMTPMLSLANSYNEEDLLDFDTQVKKATDSADDLQYVVEPKFDGGSIVLIYKEDKLVSAATRGNGQRGEDITWNIRSLATVPIHAKFSRFGLSTVELRGEAIIAKDIFDAKNKERQANDLPEFANARNAATGGLRMKNPRDTQARGIEAFLYQISFMDGEKNDQYGSHYDRINILKTLGFKVPDDETARFNTIADVVKHCQYWEEKRESYNYEIDGMVIKVDQKKYQDIVGSTSHHPKWAMAYKFKAKQATSRLESIEYQVGKIGAITPVAKITPIPLAGVTISSISLHNEDFIRARNLMIGDQVLVERSGDVIPYIVRGFPELRSGNEENIVFPTHCPSCHFSLVRAEEEAAWRCINPNCEAQVIQQLIFHVSKNAMDIDGLGRSQIEKFYSLGWLRDFSDIYHLDYSAIRQLDGYGEKSISNLQTAITKAKHNPIHRLLHSLSIHHLGQKASKLIAQEVSNVFELQEWKLEDYEAIKEIGPVLASKMTAYFSNPSNISLLKRMEELGVNMVQTEEDKPKQVNKSGSLSNKTVLFTGKLQHIGRKEAQKLAEQEGAKNLSSVTNNLDILVVGEKAGSKLKKAQAIGSVEIWTEEEFLKRINYDF